MPSRIGTVRVWSGILGPVAKAEVPVPSKKKSNAGKNNMRAVLGRRHEYRLAVGFILELLTENTINKDVEASSEVRRLAPFYWE